MPRQNIGLKLAKDLIVLERGRDELLLVNSFAPRPLYVRRGRDYVRRILDGVADLGARGRVLDAFPDDAELLDVLLEHHIASEDDTASENTPCQTCDRTPESGRSSGISLYLLLSQSCNLGCVYCLNGAQTYDRGRDRKMDEAVALRSVERCLEALEAEGTLEIVFFGGEPLLNWPLAKQVIRRCEDTLKKKHAGKEIRYHLTSNLAAVPRDLVEWARRYKISFLCDVDGCGPVHDRCRPFADGRPSHDRIARNIERLTRGGLEVGLRATVTSANQDHLLETARHHKALGGIGSAFVPVNPVNSDEHILPESMLPDPAVVIRGLSEVYASGVWETSQLFPFNVYHGHLESGQPTLRGCGAPYGNTPVVDADGEVYPCIYLVGIRRFHLGNIMREDYPDRRVLDWMMGFLHVDRMPECQGCSWRYLCGGGCPVGKLTVFENPRASQNVLQYCQDIRCDFTRRVVELVLWDLAGKAASSVDEGTRSTILC